jgi:hypothetical protein
LVLEGVLYLVFVALRSGMGWSYLLTQVSFTVADHHLIRLTAITCLCLSVAGSTFIVLGDFNFSFCSRCAPFNRHGSSSHSSCGRAAYPLDVNWSSVPVWITNL